MYELQFDECLLWWSAGVTELFYDSLCAQFYVTKSLTFEVVIGHVGLVDIPHDIFATFYRDLPFDCVLIKENLGEVLAEACKK